MEEHRKSSLRSKRKPLSDCTNTRHNHNNNNNSSKPLIKPPKNPPIFTAVTQKKNRNPNLNSSKSVLVSGSSAKLDASIGSNNSPSSGNFYGDHLFNRNSFDFEGGVICKNSTASATQTQEQNEQTRKDKGKSVVDTPIVQPSTYLASQGVQISPSTASGHDGHVSRPLETENHKSDEQRRKDKGKMVVETPIIHISTELTSHTLQTSSSAGHDDHVSRPLETENHKSDEQRRKDKGKMVVETPIIHISTELTSHTLQTSSSAASGNCFLPGPSAVASHKLDEQTSKENGKVVIETFNSEASAPRTPVSLTISSSAASGTDDQEKTSLIVYNQRRTSQRKKIGVGSIGLPFSLPPNKRTKKKGAELDDGGRSSHAGSHTDPLPLHKKKRPRNKKNDSMHAMPQDEVAKLKAYYADIDAFELPEEVASESE